MRQRLQEKCCPEIVQDEPVFCRIFFLQILIDSLRMRLSQKLRYTLSPDLTRAKHFLSAEAAVGIAGPVEGAEAARQLGPIVHEQAAQSASKEHQKRSGCQHSSGHIRSGDQPNWSN